MSALGVIVLTPPGSASPSLESPARELENGAASSGALGMTTRSSATRRPSLLAGKSLESIVWRGFSPPRRPVSWRRRYQGARGAAVGSPMIVRSRAVGPPPIVEDALELRPAAESPCRRSALDGMPGSDSCGRPPPRDYRDAVTVRRLRPFARRRFNTSRPFFVLILTRKPCVRLRWRRFG